jgi:phosphoribosylformimino-5-aminoimidazole carboxamide ribotide isomerase
MVTGGSIAVKEKDTFLSWLEKFGSDKIILGADAKDGNIAVGGWLETTELPVIDFIEGFHKKGITKVISTDISRDGMLSGPAFELYAAIMKTLPKVEIIASGGIATMNEILKLDEMGVPGVITGKAIYENRITLREIEQFIA